MTTPIDTFRELHRSGTFVIPNPWDVGSARYLEWRGFPALATTSSGLAATLGRPDQAVARDELMAHVEALTSAVAVPVNVDAEWCYPDQPGGVEATIRMAADAGAAGISIEDYNPAAGVVEPLDVALGRVESAAAECARHGLVLTARAERHLYDRDADLDETIERLAAFTAAGAEVVYAPGVVNPDDLARLLDGVTAAVNVLALPGAPPVSRLAELGVRRVSTGAGLAWAAFGGLRDAVDELERGTYGYFDNALRGRDRAGFLDGPGS